MTDLDTLVYHVCEKTTGDFIVHVPDVDAVYQQILAANNSKYPNVLLLPEYNGHEVWAEELEWIEDNFGGATGIPIMLDVFGGGSGETATPQLTTEQISAAMAVANVEWVRIAEVVSWHIEHEQPFPTDYVTALLAFCEANGLKVQWTEWKAETFEAIQTYIAGYEDIVTVTFSTNSGDLEPADGFALVKGLFTHWGASVQSWYWETRHRGTDPQNMPVVLLIQHALQARDMGAELIQLEPYWYFFGYTDGKARESSKLLHLYLNSPAGFYVAYRLVFDAAKFAVAAKTAIKTVVLGEQFTVGGLPKAIINAEPAPIAPAEMGDMLDVKVDFSVVLVILEYEPKDWFTDIIRVMGDVVDAVLADRTLAGSAKDVAPTGFAPGEIKFQDKVFYGGVVRFQAVLWYAP